MSTKNKSLFHKISSKTQRLFDILSAKGDGGQVKVSASQPRVVDSTQGHNNDSSYDTSIGWFQEADSRVIYLSCDNLFHNQAKVNMFKYNVHKLNVYLNSQLNNSQN